MNTVAKVLGGHPLETSLLLSALLTLMIYGAVYLVRFAHRFLKLDEERYGALTSNIGKFAILAPWLLVFLGWSGFFEIAEGLHGTAMMVNFDKVWVHSAHVSVATWEISFFRAVTSLAGRYASYGIGIGFALYFLLRRRRRELAVWVGGLLFNSLVVEFFKTYYQRGRPEFDQPFLVETNYSFPSGHATASLFMFGLLAYLFRRHLQWKKRPWYLNASLLLVLLGSLIGTSRLVLGVHFPSDVAAGWCAGMANLGLVIGVDLAVENRKENIERSSSEG